MEQYLRQVSWSLCCRRGKARCDVLADASCKGIALFQFALNSIRDDPDTQATEQHEGQASTKEE
jgi:hypothetical protein